MRITGYMERRGPLLACDLCAVFDHQPSNAMPANVRLDKKGIQFGFSIYPRLYCRKAYGYAAQLRHEYPPCRDLFQRDFDRIWIGKQRLAIAIIRKRCTQLQCFKGLLLGHGRGANDDAVGHRFGVSCHASNPPIITPIDRLCKANGNYWRSIWG